jgi:DNA sulfur modification protein DndC
MPSYEVNMRGGKKGQQSVFGDRGLKGTVAELTTAILELYQADRIPWVVGYSGGKDSTATLQLVWLALSELAADKRSKPVHVISTDTLVENPVVSAWVNRSLEVMGEAAKRQALPIMPHRLTPEVADTFWVNLIGRGYPAPRPKFRWCTERLKINPSNTFISQTVKENGEAIVVLGTRKQESQTRARTMERLERNRIRERLSPNASLPNSLVFTPIEDWTNDEVWMFLMQVQNPWGFNNKDLLTMYQGASPDGECPLVVDSSTPSCGDSRFGCWVCTLVDKDKSMSAMIQNDQEKEWMLPLLELRDALDVSDDRHLRDFRRMSGAVQLFHDRPIPGPYTQKSREEWLRRLLSAQEAVRRSAPPQVGAVELISLPELQEIRRLWVVEKHEFEDSLPRIFEETTGHPFPGCAITHGLVFGSEEIDLLRDLCAGDELHFGLLRELLDVERKYRFHVRRSGLFGALEAALRRAFYDDEGDAVDRARRVRDAKDNVERSTQITAARDTGDAEDDPNDAVVG